VSGTTANPWRFTSAYQDSTGFYKIGARYYRPELMRWTQLDPLEHQADPTQANRYGYAGQDPTNETDATGCGYAEYYACIAECIPYQLMTREANCRKYLDWPIIGARLYAACVSAASINSYFWCRSACRGLITAT
jgi:RHS repeat-associated protein